MSYVDNVVDAIVAALRSERANNQILTLVDGPGLTKNQYLEKVVGKVFPKAHIVRCPMAALYALTAFQELLFNLLKRRPVLTIVPADLFAAQRRLRQLQGPRDAALGLPGGRGRGRPRDYPVLPGRGRRAVPARSRTVRGTRSGKADLLTSC